jgi:hypothetical protein
MKCPRRKNTSSLVLLEIKGLEEVNKYSYCSTSSILVVKLISVERMDSAFLFPLLTAYSLFRLQLPLKCINFFEKEGQRLLPGSAFASQQALFFFCF